MAEHLRRILSGDITNLPRKESNIVRVFTSSTFTGKILVLFVFTLLLLVICQYLETKFKADKYVTLCVGGSTNLNIQSGLNNYVIFRSSQRNSALCKCFHFSFLATKMIVTALFP